jgi:hypothetical protein
MSEPFSKSDCEISDDKDLLIQSEQASDIAVCLHIELEGSQQKPQCNRLLAVLPPPPGNLRSVRHGW